MTNFDREEERREAREEGREAAELALADFKHFVRERCCLVLNDEARTLLHGRMEALLEEIEALVLRDLRPGREKLQCRLQVPYQSVFFACHSCSLEKCKGCSEYRKLEAAAGVPLQAGT